MLSRLSARFGLFLTLAGSVVVACSSTDTKPAQTSAGCLHNSDCADNLECLFRECTKICANDRDCDAGARCLETLAGSGCVTEAVATCVNGCPDSTACVNDESCRTTCSVAAGAGGSDALACVMGQVCAGTFCVGTDANHDARGYAIAVSMNLIPDGAGGTSSAGGAPQSPAGGHGGGVPPGTGGGPMAPGAGGSG